MPSPSCRIVQYTLLTVYDEPSSRNIKLKSTVLHACKHIVAARLLLLVQDVCLSGLGKRLKFSREMLQWCNFPSLISSREWRNQRITETESSECQCCVERGFKQMPDEGKVRESRRYQDCTQLILYFLFPFKNTTATSNNNLSLRPNADHIPWMLFVESREWLTGWWLGLWSKLVISLNDFH